MSTSDKSPQSHQELHPERGVGHAFIVQMGYLMHEMERSFSNKVGMGKSRMELLDVVFHAQEISQTELTQRLTIDASLVSRFVKQMEAEGLLTRRVDPKDNRFTLVSLGPEAANVFARVEALGKEYETRLLEGVSDQKLESALDILKRLIENLEQWDS